MIALLSDFVGDEY